MYGKCPLQKDSRRVAKSKCTKYIFGEKSIKLWISMTYRN